MQAGWMMGVMLAALVVAPAATFSAESRKPKEIVVVGSKAKKSSGQYVLTRPAHPARAHKIDALSWKMKVHKQKAAKAGRRLTDCEGYAYMTQNVFGGSCR
ncbi:MAG: hypothetical protein HC868_17415 [Sphingomonadales bacterium]|nr:hypothetical protein [Sphingomonadales bacterium]